MKQVKKFEVGKKYSMRSACNQDCVWTYQVISRTESTVVLQQVRNGKPFGEHARMRVKKKFTEICGAEVVMPQGTYSMAPMLRAE